MIICNDGSACSNKIMRWVVYSLVAFPVCLCLSVLLLFSHAHASRATIPDKVDTHVATSTTSLFTERAMKLAQDMDEEEGDPGAYDHEDEPYEGEEPYGDDSPEIGEEPGQDQGDYETVPEHGDGEDRAPGDYEGGGTEEGPGDILPESIAPEEKLKPLYKEGEKNYLKGNYQDALDAFFAVKHQSESAAMNQAMLWNIAQCYEKQSKNNYALIYLRLFLDTGPSAEDQEKARKKIKALEGESK